MGDNIGLRTRLIVNFSENSLPQLQKYHVMFIINQIRMKIGIMFGSPETTTERNALKFMPL